MPSYGYAVGNSLVASKWNVYSDPPALAMSETHCKKPSGASVSSARGLDNYRITTMRLARAAASRHLARLTRREACVAHLLWLCDHHVAVHEDSRDALLDALEDRRT
jgi:hypothetical protein